MEVRMKSRYMIIAAAMILVIVCAALPATAGTRLVDATDFIEMITSTPHAQIIDVRPDEYRNWSYIDGSVGFPLSTLSSRVGELDLTRTIFVYCQSGKTSGEAVNLLSGNGADDIVELSGGLLSIFRLLTTEPAAVSSDPEKAALFDKLRSILLIGPAGVGVAVPSLSFSSETGDVKPFSSFVGKNILLAFLSPADRQQFDTLSSMADYITNNSLAITPVAVFVYHDDTEIAALKSELKNRNPSLMVYYDKDGRAARRLGLNSTPYYNLIDQKGIMRAHGIASSTAQNENYSDLTLTEMMTTLSVGKIPPYPLSEEEINTIRQEKLVGHKAPEFELQDAGGKTYSLSQLYKDRGALLVFGTIHCPHTDRQIKLSNTCGFAPENGDPSVAAILAASDFDQPENIPSFISHYDIKIPVLIDRNNKAFKDYFISAVPVWWIVGKDGTILKYGVGASIDTCDDARKLIK